VKNKSLISFLVGIILFGVAIYVTYYVTTIVDFREVIVIINDDENLWKFMAFIPMLVLMFSGGLAIINGIFNTKAIAITVIIINIALTLFLRYDLYGFVTIINNYKITMDYVFLIVLVASLMLLVDQIINNGLRFKKEKKKTKKKLKTA